MENATNQSKLRWERQKCRKKLREDEECNFEIINAIYGDVQKVATLTTIENSDPKFYFKTEIEEHYIFVGEPGKL